MWVTVSADDAARIEQCVAIMHRMGARYDWMTAKWARRALLNRGCRRTGKLFYYEHVRGEIALMVYRYQRQRGYAICGGLTGTVTPAEALALGVPKLKEVAFDLGLSEYQVWWPIPWPNPEFAEVCRLAKEDPELRLELVVQTEQFTIDRLTFVRAGEGGTEGGGTERVQGERRKEVAV